MTEKNISWNFFPGLILGFVLLRASDSLIIKESPVRLRILEYSSREGNLLKVLNSRFSDLVVGEEVANNTQIVLECSSLLGPLRWIFSGDGQPQYKSYYSSTSRSGSPVSYIAYLSFPNGLVAKDTGQYTCQNSYNSSVSNFVYLYVPKRDSHGKLPLFVTSGKGRDLPISNGKTTARIPCGVVHPAVRVSLEKVSTSKSFYLEPPMRVPFDPKSGFTVEVSPTGHEVYTCRAEYKGEFDEVTYNIVPVRPRMNPEAELLHEFLVHYSSPNTTVRFVPSSTTASPLTHEQVQPSKPIIPAPDKLLVSACTPTFCANNAECIVKDYQPYCVCLENYTGNPKIGCHQISDHSHLRVEDPCNPSPCGVYGECIQVNGHPLCTCKSGYFGSPPKCSPFKFTNCTKNYDCEWTEYCNTNTKRCESICEGHVKFCGKGAVCTAFSHMPYCACSPGTGSAGDPYDTEGPGCHVQSDRFQEESMASCNPSPCGRNAHCKVYSSYPLPICFCPVGFTGDPSHRCYKLSPSPAVDVFRPQIAPHAPSQSAALVSSSTVPSHEASLSDPAVRLCTSTLCGENARCRFRNNHPDCHCLNGYKGDPYKGCQRATLSPNSLRKMCSVCGPNSMCSMVSSEVRCQCAPDTIGSPPNCRRVFSSDASSLSQQPSRSASSSLRNPQVSIVTSALVAHLNNRHHQISSVSSSFHLLPHQKHDGNSHFACTSDLDCPDDKICYTAKRKCLNPCSWACSDAALCTVTNHHVRCRCPTGFSGNPYIQCDKTPTTVQPESESDQQQIIPADHPCRFTCGANSVCRRISSHEMNRLRMSAFSMDNMERDPFQRALVQYIQRVTETNDNYKGIHKQGQSAKSIDSYHTECMCMDGAVGNPYSIEGCSFPNNNVKNKLNNSSNRPFSHDLQQASSINSNTIVIPVDPCRQNVNPCGKHSICVAFQSQAFCRCDYDATGEPPNCVLRCGKGQHCLFHQDCVQGKCVPQLGRSEND